MQEVDKLKDFTQQMVDMIFSFGELGFQEVETSRYITTILRENGFSVEEGVSGIPTAWIARWGSGKPVIAFGSDIDCIPKASQKPGVAEEQLGAKAYFARDGVMKDVDAVLFTHVSDNLGVSFGPDSSGTGLVSVEYTFKGSSAHSAGRPWRGRSALDAVELMDIKNVFEIGNKMAQAAAMMTDTEVSWRILGARGRSISIKRSL